MRVWSVLAVVLLVAACGGPKPQVPEKTRSGPPDTSNVKINGDASDPVNKLVIQAIADLEKYWGKEMPELYQEDFELITGGYYAVNPSTDDAPPCASAASEVAGKRSTARPRTSSPGTPKNCYPHCRRNTATSSSRW
jgi:hypothetical protein